MNGAESLLETLTAHGIEVCFANPGTSEMHLVAALDRIGGMRCVLGLFEGVVTGAADGYARMLDRPAATLLHLGPGLANGLSNLHNAARAHSPIVNIIGDHAIRHVALDAPLTADVVGIARPFSHWVRTSTTANAVAPDTAAAVAAARSAPGCIASLIVPADVAWGPVSAPARTVPTAELVRGPSQAMDCDIEAAASLLHSGEPTAIVLGGRAARERPLEAAGRIAAATGATLFAQGYTARITRGAGRVPVERIPFLVDSALRLLAGFANVILVGTKVPVAFFAYPDKPGKLVPASSRIHELVDVTGDAVYGLEALADRLCASTQGVVKAALEIPGRPSGAITPERFGALLAATLPENAIVVDESITTGRNFLAATRNARPHDWILGTGGAIGYAMPVGCGAAIACPDRKVIVLESDGSGLFMPQTLWTYARESLNVLVILFANHKYQILRNEWKNVSQMSMGPRASDLLDIGRPEVDWVGLAKSLGVEAARAESMEDLARLIDAGLAIRGPSLIEVVL